MEIIEFFTHFAFSICYDLSPTIKNSKDLARKNLNRGKAHLERATLDILKSLVVTCFYNLKKKLKTEKVLLNFLKGRQREIQLIGTDFALKVEEYKKVFNKLQEQDNCILKKMH